MATRATIKIEGINFAKLYKHFDGYPNATLKWLEDFNKDFFDNRGDDPEYKFAQLLRSSVRDSYRFDLDDSKYTGWGIVDYDAVAGENYEYTLLNDGSVTYTAID